MSAAYDAIAKVRELHKPEPADVRCEAETWAPDHYGAAVDPYWIRCSRVGRHSEHSDSGNTGCTWPLTQEDRYAQAQIHEVCEADDEWWPCRTIRLLPTPAPRPVAAEQTTPGTGGAS